ncbi:MAG: hypothetical protein ACREUU_12350 [Gammaproteobacteria bacterium]
MQKLIVILASAFQFCVLTVSGQVRNEVAAVGFVTPRATLIAPGELVTLYVRGLAAGPAVASALPLPTNLAGVSVLIKQPGGFSALAPVVRILPLDAAGLGCRGLGGGLICRLTAVTIQVPTNLPFCEPDEGLGANPPSVCPGETSAVVAENGVTGAEFMNLVVSPQQAHIINACDTMAFGSPARVIFGSCLPIILRADGSPVSGANPARPGEVVSVFAVGLGPTSVALPSGVPSPSPPIQVALPVQFRFAFRTDIRPSEALNNGEVLFAGLTPGFVGLYQVNVRLPSEIPSEVRRCGLAPADANMTLVIAAGRSADGVQICLNP